MKIKLLILSLLFLPAFANAADIVSHGTLGSGLEMYWAFEEGDGAVRVDATTTGQLTDNNTVVQTTGKIGNAASTSRVAGSYFSNPDNASTSFTGSLSMNVWLKPGAVPATSESEGLIGKGNGDRAYYYAYGFSNCAGSNFELYVALDPDGSGPTPGQHCHALGTSPISSASWTMITIVYDTGVDDTEYFVDGTSVETDTGVPASIFDGTSALLVGGNAVFNTHVFDGGMDEMGLWSRPLSGTEVTALWNSGDGLAFEEAAAPATPDPEVFIIFSLIAPLRPFFV